MRIHTEPTESKSRLGKFIVLVLVVMVALGGLGYWYLARAPEPSEEPPGEPAAPVVEREPVPVPREVIPSTGSLAVSSNVPGAAVYLGDERVGETPFEDEDLAIGRYQLRVEKEGYQPFIRGVRIRPGRSSDIQALLDLVPPSLHVSSDVPGATVFLDRNYAGTTPVTIEDVAPGEHELTVSAEGYDMYAETVTVEETGRREVKVSFRSVDLNESIQVVHKHTFGSCEGVLIADESGIRYETDNENDAFHVGFGALERFEIDYMDENLNIKIRNGKNYNFTEPSGDADALFVFHKSVQEFMERL